MKNSQGFSLIQVLIAAGILGGLSLGVMQLSLIQTKSTSSAESNFEISAIVNEMRSILADPVNCLSSFGGDSAASSTGKDRLKKGGTDKFIVGQRYGQGKVKINSYTLTNADPALASDETHLVINFYRGQSTTTPNINKKIVLQVKPDNASVITECVGVSNAASTIWERDPVVINNIFYNAGDVSAGANLGVTGDATIQGNATVQSNATIQGNATVQGNTTIQGGATVGSSIKIGTSVACTAAEEGSMRYNSTSKLMEFCNGTAWGNVGSSGTLDCTMAVGADAVNPTVLTCPAGYQRTGCFTVRESSNSAFRYSTFAPDNCIARGTGDYIAIFCCRVI